MSYPITPVDLLAVQVRLTKCGFTPEPERGSLVGESVALLLSETLPLNVPVAVGAKVTLKEVLWPALSVWGRLRSPSLKPVPATLALEMVTAAVPVLVTITENTVL